MKTFAALCLNVSFCLALTVPLRAEAATSWRISRLSRTQREQVLFSACNRQDADQRERCYARQRKKVTRRGARTQPYGAEDFYRKVDRGRQRQRKNLQARRRASSRIEARKHRRSWSTTAASGVSNTDEQLSRRRATLRACMQETSRRLRSECLDRQASVRDRDA